uniref:Uncharacterized protein n=1 Tax=Rhizophora mucronata TaxID=61149 RepID=A0A2P2PF07_RHIMU
MNGLQHTSPPTHCRLTNCSHVPLTKIFEFRLHHNPNCDISISLHEIMKCSPGFEGLKGKQTTFYLLCSFSFCFCYLLAAIYNLNMQ